MVMWAEFTVSATTSYWGTVTLPDPASYFGGLKEARLLNVSAIRRALSGPHGDYETGRFEVTLADTDRSIRAMLATTPGKYWTRRMMAVRMISDEDRRAGLTPILVGYGVVEEAPVLRGLEVTFRLNDFVGSQRWTQS